MDRSGFMSLGDLAQGPSPVGAAAPTCTRQFRPGWRAKKTHDRSSFCALLAAARTPNIQTRPPSLGALTVASADGRAVRIRARGPARRDYLCYAKPVARVTP
jgi:hypothetical protein